jgi:hypothetical protein
MAEDVGDATVGGRWARVRRHLLGAFLVYHLTAVFVMSLPAPSGGMKRSAWADPTVQGEFAAWRGRLAAVGWAMEAETFEDRLWDLGTAWMKVRNLSLYPFIPYYKCCGTRQSWRMFVAPHRYPARLVIEVEERGEWRTLFEEGRAGLDWREEVLESDRFRSALFRYSWAAYGGAYKRFGRWVSARVGEDFPEASRVRLHWYKYKTLGPVAAARGDEPKGEFVSELTLSIRREAP